jgi:hypothetical protein
MIRAWVSRFYMLIGSITIAVTVVLSGGTESRADDTPSLQKENGPYMVVAHVFRGPDAERHAKALTLELRQDNKLPAYLYRWSPNGDAKKGGIVVLVGDAKTPLENELLQKQVRAINPRCLADLPNPSQRSLARAYRTTNPLLPNGNPPTKRR